jgi:hypothetical protein
MSPRFAFAALLLLPSSLLALDWSTHGPKGGAVAQVAFSPAAPRVGDTCPQRRNGRSAPILRRSPSLPTRAAPGSSTPFNSNAFVTVFAVSSNGGETWQSVTPPLLDGVESVVFDPAQPSTVYAGGLGGLARSTDNGVTWSLLATYDTRLLAIAPSNRSRL